MADPIITFDTNIKSNVKPVLTGAARAAGELASTQITSALADSNFLNNLDFPVLVPNINVYGAARFVYEKLRIKPYNPDVSPDEPENQIAAFKPNVDLKSSYRIDVQDLQDEDDAVAYTDFGKPIYDYIVFGEIVTDDADSALAVKFPDDNLQDEFRYLPGLQCNNVSIGFASKKNIKRTTVQGGNTPVFEYINNDNIELNIVCRFVGDTPNSLPKSVNALQNICRVDYPIKVKSKMLNDLDIFEIVVKNFSRGQTPGKYNYQEIKISALGFSKTEDESNQNGNKTLNELVVDEDSRRGQAELIESSYTEFYDEAQSVIGEADYVQPINKAIGIINLLSEYNTVYVASESNLDLQNALNTYSTKPDITNLDSVDLNYSSWADENL